MWLLPIICLGAAAKDGLHSLHWAACLPLHIELRLLEVSVILVTLVPLVALPRFVPLF